MTLENGDFTTPVSFSSPWEVAGLAPWVVGKSCQLCMIFMLFRVLIHRHLFRLPGHLYPLPEHPSRIHEYPALTVKDGGTWVSKEMS